MLKTLRSSRVALPALLSISSAIIGCASQTDNVPEAPSTAGGSSSTGAGGASSTTTSTTVPGSGGLVIPLGSGGMTSAGGNSATSTTKPAVCGDGTQDLGERCDDGNTNSGDGCSAECSMVEEGYVCSEPGKACKPSQVCGDKIVSGTENCDDGNRNSGDGCSEQCHTEDGWACPIAGARCVADRCGDGIVVGTENCDDGNSVSGDGCSALCIVESPGATERDAWKCPDAGQPCQRTTCGDSNVEGTEQCDDGNNDTGDGCSPACRKEPKCPVDGGACKSVCGDGMILPDDTDQECDDGNSTNGDGCDSDCKKELGYECTNEAVKPTGKLILPIVYRDFKGGTTTGTGLNAVVTWDTAAGEHPDFEHASGKAEAGIVKSKLGSNGKPVHSDMDMVTTTNNDTASTPDWFSLWYRDAVQDLPTQGSPRYNYTFLENLTLAETAAGSGTFTFSNTSFFPLDTKSPSWGITTGTNPAHNFHFTSEVRYWFQYQGNELLKFTGDDDVWVFVNKQLALDLGGIHNVWTGSVQLDASNGSASVVCSPPPRETGTLACQTAQSISLGLELGKVYEIVVFQAERHTTLSNYTLTVSAFTSTRSVCKPVCGDGILTPDEACDLGKDDQGNSLNTGAYGTCNPDCTLPPTCGDGKVDKTSSNPDVYEECDDGVNLASYGYNGNKEACGPGCKLMDYCGDGKVDSLFGEECDDGNGVARDGCEPNCTHRVGCGNGILEAGEQCDDGNTTSGDGCTEFCTIPTILL